VENTGSWLLEKHAAFQRWMDPKETPPNVFILSGGEGYGKSCLSSAVVHHLLEKYPKGRSDHRVAVGYYYFRRDAKEKSSVNKAIRDIIYQLTQYDSAYAKKIAPVVAESRDLTKTLDIWKLFGTYVDGQRDNSIHVVGLCRLTRTKLTFVPYPTCLKHLLTTLPITFSRGSQN
jgi:Cdc6-like AAA superfamily ATPase